MDTHALEIARAEALGSVLGIAAALVIRADNHPKLTDIFLCIEDLGKALNKYDAAAKAYLDARLAVTS